MTSSWEYLLFISSKDKASRAIPNADFRGNVSNIYRGKPQRNNQFSEIHAATFPVELPEWAIQFTKQNDIIFDSFLGTGTTLIAAEKTNRKCYGMELDPKYCDVIVKRWEDFTGKKAHLEENRWMEEDTEYADAVKDIQESAIDFAESSLHQQIKEKVPSSTIFYLKTKGKNRGYVEKQQIEINEPKPFKWFDDEN